MQTPEPLVQFDRLRERLLRGGVAPRHVHRTLGELRDHYDDAMLAEIGNGLDENTAEQTAWQRLGDEDTIAANILARPELRSWTARAPWAVMVLGPILTMIVAGILLGLVVIGLAFVYRWIAPWPGRVEPIPLQMFVHVVTVFTVFVLPLVIGWAAARIAIQQRLRPLWPLLGLALFAFISGTFGMEVTFPKVLGEPGELSLGFSWMGTEFQHDLDRMDISPMRWVVNFVLLVGPYLVWRYKGKVGRDNGMDVDGAKQALS